MIETVVKKICAKNIVNAHLLPARNGNYPKMAIIGSFMAAAESSLT